MKDEHFYTRALKLNPENAMEYYLGRADFYCIEHEYKKAYKDFLKAKNLGANIEKSYRFKTCQDYIEADEKITDLTKQIEKNVDNYMFFCERAKYYLLKNQYDKAMTDSITAIQIYPCLYTYEFWDDLTKKIREFNVFDIVKNAPKIDLINALKLRIQLAKENIILYKNPDYWTKRAENDLNKIIELSKDKTLALYLRVNFYEELKDIRRFNNDKRYIRNAISTCKRVVEQSKSRTDRLGKTLTYLYEVKLCSLYSNEDEMEKSMQIALCHPDRPVYADLKKGLKYINNFAFMHVDVLRGDELRREK